MNLSDLTKGRYRSPALVVQAPVSAIGADVDCDPHFPRDSLGSRVAMDRDRSGG